MLHTKKKFIAGFLSCLIGITGLVAQSPSATAAGPVLGAGFTITVSDLQFILQQIRIADSHRAIEATSPAVTPSTNVLSLGRPLTDFTAAGTTTIAAATTQVASPLLPEGLRQVDGRNNNLTANGFSSWIGFGYISPIPTVAKSAWGAADTDFPRTVPASFRTVNGKSYSDRTGDVTDAAPRVISNLISDQSVNNPAARAAASCTVTGPTACVPSTTDNASLVIKNRATNNVAAPYNGNFALFGQFFDHGLDLVGKSGTTSVKVPLATSDPLYTTCVNLTNRGCVTEMTLGRTVLGTDPATAGTNTTTPWVDQNQTYTSHPSHQVFLREYYCHGSETPSNISLDTPCTTTNYPVATGKLLDGTIAGNIANWAEIKKQAANKLGIQLVDMDIHDVPLLLTDEYGRFLRSASKFPQVVVSHNGSIATVRVGNPASPVLSGMGTGHAFLNDISHFAAPAAGLLPDVGTAVNNYPGTGYYDNELLDAHFITGDGRGNENIGLTAVHTVFHAEHNRLWTDIQNVITSATTGSTGLSANALSNFKNAWKMSAGGTEWNGERLFQASRLITEMEYQHLVFGEFARKVQPLIKPFVAYDPTIRPDITAEFAHAVYRYGHSQLNQTVDRTSATGADLSVPLLYAFLNPTEFNQPHTYPSGNSNGSPLDGAAAAGSILRGMTNQTGNEIDEFVTGALRNSLLGLPLDLATLNLARGRDAGVPSLNSFRTSLYASTGITSLAPYGSWAEFGQSLRHPESLVNFVAAYGVSSGIQLPGVGAANIVLDPSDNTVSYTDKRAAAQSVVDCFESNQGIHDLEPCVTFMTGSSGLDGVDLWIGGLAEKNTQFGTMLGSTFDYVFKKQLENLQESDRFYYLGRLAGLNLTVQVETNFLSDIIMRNTDIVSIPTDAFAVPTVTIDMSQPKPDFIKLLTGGVWMYTGTGHVLWNGTTGDDKVLSDRGDDSIYGAAGNDWLRGGDGNDFVQGGDGRDVIEDSAGLNILIGGNGNDYISGSGTDSYNGNSGDDFLYGGAFPVVALAGIGNDWVRGGSDNDTLSGDEGNDWIEGGQGGDAITGDTVGPAGVTLTFPGNDVLIGNSGNDLLDGFDGADIYVPGDGTDLNTGGLGFDWVTYYNDGQSGGVNEDMSNFAPAPGLVLPNLADQYQEIEALSGSDSNDTLSGTSVTTLGGTAANGLSARDCAMFTDGSLTALLPSTVTNCVWNAGDIIIGGAGSDIITGRNGNDLIDGDAVLQTWISIPSSWGIANEAPNYVTVPAGRAYVASMNTIRSYVASHLVSADVMADLLIVRTIQSAGHSSESDVAVYQAARANYTITVNANGTITVVDPRNGGGATIDGTDTLRNIEILRFTDVDVLVSSLAPAAPTGVAATGGSGSIAVTWSASITSGTIANYTARAWATSARTGTPVGTCTTANGTTLTCTIDNATANPAHSGLAAASYYVDVIATTTASQSSLASAGVGPIVVTQAPATNIVVTTGASGSVTGQAFTTQPVIQIRNALGGIVTNSTAVVTASVSAGATIVGTATATAVAGVARFTNLGLTGTAGTPYTITYSITVPSAISATESVTPTASGALVNLSVGRPISGAANGVAATTQPVINIVDGLGATITSDNTSVVTASATGATLSGTTTATATSGVATFSGLIVNGTPGSTYTITYSLPSGVTTTQSLTLSSGSTPTPVGSAPTSAPSIASVVGGIGDAIITWSAVTGATRYTAQAFSSASSSKVVRQCSVTSNGSLTTYSCTIPRLQSRLTYYVDVVARNTAGALSSASRIPVTIL